MQQQLRALTSSSPGWVDDAAPLAARAGAVRARRLDDAPERPPAPSSSAPGSSCSTAFVGLNQWLFVARRRLPGLARSSSGCRARAGVPPMSTIAAPAQAARTAPEHPEAVGPLGRLGRWTADHVRAVAIAWASSPSRFGVFAPKVETALSGAGWQANGSESVQARQLIQANFAGLSSSALMVVVHSPSADGRRRPAFRQTLARVEQRPAARTGRSPRSSAPRAGSTHLRRRAHRARDGRREGRPDGDGRRRRRAQVEAAAPPAPPA